MLWYALAFDQFPLDCHLIERCDKNSRSKDFFISNVQSPKHLPGLSMCVILYACTIPAVLTSTIACNAPGRNKLVCSVFRSFKLNWSNAENIIKWTVFVNHKHSQLLTYTRICTQMYPCRNSQTHGHTNTFSTPSLSQLRKHVCLASLDLRPMCTMDESHFLSGFSFHSEWFP